MATTDNALKTALAALHEAEQARERADEQWALADQQLDRAIAARGWRRLNVAGATSTTTPVYQDFTGALTVPRPQLLAELQRQEAAA